MQRALSSSAPLLLSLASLAAHAQPATAQKAWALALRAAEALARGDRTRAHRNLAQAVRYLDSVELRVAAELLDPKDLGALEREVRSRGETGAAHYWLGRQQLCAGRLARACASFRAAASLEPSRPSRHLAVALACRAAGRSWIQAARTAARLQWDLLDPRLYPDRIAGVLELVGSSLGPLRRHRRYLLSLATLSFRTGHLRQTEAMARQVLQSRGEVPDAMFLLAAALQRAGWPERARSWIRKGLALNPDHPGLLALAGEQALRHGRWTEARKALERSVAVDPTSPVTLSRLADLWWRTGAYAKAEKLYRYALARDSNFGPAHYGLARVFQRRREYQEAERHYRAAIRANPANPKYRFGFALFLRLRKRIAEARRQDRAGKALRRAWNRAERDLERARKYYASLRRLHAALGEELRPPKPPRGPRSPVAFLLAHHGRGSPVRAVARLGWRRLLCGPKSAHIFVRQGRLPGGGRFQLVWTLDFVPPGHLR